MNLLKNIFPSAIAALRPRLACEIMPGGVAAARHASASHDLLSSFVPLPAGILSPGLKPPVLGDRALVVDALRRALGGVGQRDTNVTLVIPDLSARVLVLDFDDLPAKAADVMPILRFRLRKLVPFEVEDAAISYQVLSRDKETVRAVLAVVPGPVLAEYESAVRQAGYEPGAVLPSTIAALAALKNEEPSLVVNRNGNSVTTAITRQNELLLHRTLDLGFQDSPQEGFEREAWTPERRLQQSSEDLQQSVSVAIAYFEDTLGGLPHELLACGLGGAEELDSLLGGSAVPARDLIPASSSGNTTSIPRGALAGVAGALAS